MNTPTKNRWLSWLVYIVLFLVVMQGASWWKSRDTQSGNLSEFSGELMNGTTFTIADFSGEPVLFHFWSTWCPICDLEKNSIESISHDYPVISIASWSEGKTEVNAYMLENQLTFPVMLDNSGELAQSFGLKGVPASFILSPDGEITFVETGYSTELGLRLRLWLSTL
ncbi:MAG: redoxin domain-containing protein [Gammaproteobacteria bacterium]|nr:redoxin domain-containing protein [Gammaproteobacteria bacterium]